MQCRALIIATGVSYHKLEALGIEDLTGAGAYYGAAMTEGESIRGKDVYLVGGANSAGQAAMYFSRYAATVTLLVRGESLSNSMSSYLIDQIECTDNIRVWTGTTVHEAVGNGRLDHLILQRGADGATETVPAAALSIFVGAVPRTAWLGDQIARDEQRFILSGLDALSNDPVEEYTQQKLTPFMPETNITGVFVAGDVRHGSVKRVASAVGEGSMAVMYVPHYLSRV